MKKLYKLSMRNNRIALALLLTTALTVAAYAVDITGKWNGKVEIQADSATMAQIKAQGGKMPTVSIELKANKTYLATQTGGGDGKPHTSEGTWSLSGNKVIMTPKKRDGKAATGEMGKPRTYELSKDGKTLSTDLSAQVKSAADKSGQKQVPKMTVKIILKKNS